MNNKYFSSLLCITILACAPACKRQEKENVVRKEQVKTMIELDNEVVEVETTEITQSIVKF